MRKQLYYKYNFKIINETVACYGCEIWLLKTEEQRKLLALEMDYLRRSARASIRNKMQAEQ